VSASNNCLMKFLKKCQPLSTEQTYSNTLNQRQRQSTELILSNQLVQIHIQQFKNETKMLLVNKVILKTDNVSFIRYIMYFVQLYRMSTEIQRSTRSGTSCMNLISNRA